MATKSKPAAMTSSSTATFLLSPIWTAAWLVMPLAVLLLLPYGLTRSLGR